MNDELHNKVVKFFYDHEELFIAIMNKTPYQSDGWDYEIEVVKEFLTANQSCYCGDIYNLGVIHRDDGPCHYPNDKEPEQEPVGINGLTKAEEDATASVKGLINTTPPQRKPLTDEQIGDISKNYALSNPTTPLYFARAIEAAHGIKE